MARFGIERYPAFREESQIERFIAKLERHFVLRPRRVTEEELTMILVNLGVYPNILAAQKLLRENPHGDVDLVKCFFDRLERRERLRQVMSPEAALTPTCVSQPPTVEAERQPLVDLGNWGWEVLIKPMSEADLLGRVKNELMFEEQLGIDLESLVGARLVTVAPPDDLRGPFAKSQIPVLPLLLVSSGQDLSSISVSLSAGQGEQFGIEISTSGMAENVSWCLGSLSPARSSSNYSYVTCTGPDRVKLGPLSVGGHTMMYGCLGAFLSPEGGRVVPFEVILPCTMPDSEAYLAASKSGLRLLA